MINKLHWEVKGVKFALHISLSNVQVYFNVIAILRVQSASVDSLAPILRSYFACKHIELMIAEPKIHRS